MKESLIDPKKIDSKIWELSQTLWRIESIANLSGRAIDGHSDGSQFHADLNGSLQAIAMLCKESQNILELGIQRPNDLLLESAKTTLSEE